MWNRVICFHLYCKHKSSISSDIQAARNVVHLCRYLNHSPPWKTMRSRYCKLSPYVGLASAITVPPYSPYRHDVRTSMYDRSICLFTGSALIGLEIWSLS